PGAAEALAARESHAQEESGIGTHTTCGMSALAPLLADMKTLIGALTVGTILVGVSALAADAQHLRQPKHDHPERLRMIRECMGMHNKHGGDMPFHSGGNERLYRACMATRGHHG